MATAKKKTASKPKTAKKTSTAKEAERRLRVPEPVINLQKRVLEGQESLFETTYNAFDTLSESQEDAIHTFLENASFVPKQVREIADLWTTTNRQTRGIYKHSVEETFKLANKWVDGLAQKSA